MKDLITVAAVQYEITGVNSDKDLYAKLEACLETAREERADLVILPELFTLDLLHPTTSQDEENRQIREIARVFRPAFFDRVRYLARSLRLSILAGSVPRIDPQAPRILNTAILAFPDGTEVLQDKVHISWGERSEWKWHGGRQGVRVFDTPWGKTTILMGHDVEFPSLSTGLAAEQPELILVPARTCDLQGFRRVRWCAQARAIEHHAYVVHTGTVGPGTQSPGMMGHHYGQAAFLGPCDEHFEGEYATGTLNEPSVVIQALDLRKLREMRPRARVYPARDQIQHP